MALCVVGVRANEPGVTHRLGDCAQSSVAKSMHSMTMMTSFAITLYGQCCRLHVVGQRAVSDMDVVRCTC